MPIYDKENKEIGSKNKSHRKNIPAFVIAGIVVVLLLYAGVLFASEAVSDFVTSEFSYQVPVLNSNKAQAPSLN